MFLKYRSIVSVILLSLLTCGIYAIYYLITTQESIRDTYKKEELPSGLFVFLVGLVTCGIYYIYWMYKTANIMNEILKENGLPYSESDVLLFVILGVFTGSLVYNVLLQSKINLIVENSSRDEFNKI